MYLYLILPREIPINIFNTHQIFSFPGNNSNIHISQVSGTMMNTGHSVIFTVDNDTRHHINVTGGPLSYKYQFQEIHVHYGLHDQFGSEHSINGYAFPAEVRKLYPHIPLFNKIIELGTLSISDGTVNISCGERFLHFPLMIFQLT